jgi:L-fuconate dehydratase
MSNFFHGFKFLMLLRNSHIFLQFLVSCIDFRYCTDVLDKDEAVKILKNANEGFSQRERDLISNGYPAYTTATGWLNYSNAKMIELCEKYQSKGFKAFKIKIGVDLKRDIERCQLMRDQIGYENTFMVDSNQIFDVNEAIEWVMKLKEFKPLWIEEPTSPDDVLGNAKIAEALR